MGRRTFSRAEADGIRRLLREKGIADRDRQKALRGQLRRTYDFYISDFTADSAGFTASDFDQLASIGTIEIEEPDRTTALKADESPQAVIEKESGSVLADVLAPNLDVVFCGTAVGNRSARVGAYYAGRGNKFWSTLHRVGLTPLELSPSQFAELPQYGVGLTDLAKFASGNDREVSTAELDVPGFRQRISAVSPRVVAFNGKRSAEAFLGRAVSYGQQTESIGQTAIFVLPSTSGAAQGHWDESHWRALSRFVGRRTGP
jgi:TDG/mug DNA glycosylase family protein